MKKRIFARASLIIWAVLLIVSLLPAAVYAELYEITDDYDEPVYNSDAIPSEQLKGIVEDEAGILSSYEVSSLSSKLEDISARHYAQVSIVTVRGRDNYEIEAFTDDYYDYNGYGKGAERSGIMLLMDMSDRSYHITTTGFGITAFTDAGQNYIMEKVIDDYFRQDEWYGGFVAFADYCDDFLTQAETGDPYDVGNLPKTSFKDTLPALIVALPAGLIPAAGIRKGMKNQLKSVRKAYAADSYADSSSMDMKYANDQFLFRNVTKTRHVDPERTGGGGGGSSTHVSSSGTTHGGSSGHF